MSKRFVILAPHADDELIGCFRLLKNNLVCDVYYFYDLTEERKQEAEVCSRVFDFKPHFFERDLIHLPLALPSGYVMLVPNIWDHHPHHRKVNEWARNHYPIHLLYYSVDMNVTMDVLRRDEQEQKLSHLQKIYVSQRAVFHKNDQYHLFESLLYDDDLWLSVDSRQQLIKVRPHESQKVDLNEIRD